VSLEHSNKMKTFLSALAVLIVQAEAHSYGYQGLNEVFERGPAVKAVVDDYGYDSVHDADVLEYNRLAQEALADETNVMGYGEPLVARKIAVHHEPVLSYREVAVHKEPVQFVAAQPVRYEAAVHREPVHYEAAVHREPVRYEAAVHREPVRYEAAVHREPVHYEAAVHREVAVTEPAPVYAPAARYERVLVDSPAHREVTVMAARPLMHKVSAPLVVEAVKPVVLKKVVHVEPTMHRNNYVARGLQYGENGPFASTGVYSQGFGRSTRPLFRMARGYSGKVAFDNLDYGDNGAFASSGLYSQGVGHSTRPLFRIEGGSSGKVGMKNLKH